MSAADDDGPKVIPLRGELAAPRERLPLVWFDDASPVLNMPTIVKGVLAERSLSVIYGESGCGKTFLTLDLALHIAAGWEWFGHKTVQTGVVYIAAEGGYAIMNRIAAFKLAHDGQSYEGRLPFAIIPAQVNLLDPHADLLHLIERIAQAGEICGRKIGLIVVDTLSRALAGGDENSSVDMGTFVTNVDRLRTETAAHGLLVHHTGKDAARGSRGWSGLRGALDTEMEVACDPVSKLRTLKITKQRDLPTEGDYQFRLENVTLGEDIDGDPVTSCYVTACDEAVFRPKKKLASIPALALQELENCISNHGFTAPGSNHIPGGVTGVTSTLWRDTLIMAGIINKEGNYREQFKRINVTLKSEGFIGSWDEFVWRVT